MPKVRVHTKLSGEETEATVPTDLRQALDSAPLVEVVWDSLTPIGRRDFVIWIDSAKQEETRKRRIEKALSMLAAGKRRPCCFALVPMNLYTALAANPKAQAQWKDLTPGERRDFVSWVDAAKHPQSSKLQIDKVCVLLSSGKRRPR